MQHYILIKLSSIGTMYYRVISLSMIITLQDGSFKVISQYTENHIMHSSVANLILLCFIWGKFDWI